jgi:hypothetical protein
MTDYEKKRAQIEILEHLLVRLCNSELPEIGRIAIKRLINTLRNVTENAEN